MIARYANLITEQEAKYFSYELEVLAVVASVDRFRQYLLGRSFKVVTDCSAVTQTFAKKEIGRRVARWILKLQEYEFTFEHRPGTKMRHADSLSRNPTGEAVEEEPVMFHVMQLEIDEEDFLVTMQRQDSKLMAIMTSLQQPIQSNYDRQIRQDYDLVRSRLMRKTGDKLKWVVPERVRWRILKAYHDDMGHMAEEKVLENMKKNDNKSSSLLVE